MLDVAVAGISQAFGSGSGHMALNDAGVVAVASVNPADLTDRRTAFADAPSPYRPLPVCDGVPSHPSLLSFAHFRETVTSFSLPQLRSCGALCELPLLASSAHELQPPLLPLDEQSLHLSPIVRVDRGGAAAVEELAWDAVVAAQSSVAVVAAV